MKDVNFVDITIENAKPGKGNISFSDFVISFDNNRYDATNSILNFEVNEDIKAANEPIGKVKKQENKNDGDTEKENVASKSKRKTDNINFGQFNL